MKKSVNLSQLRPLEQLTQVDRIEIRLQEYFRKEHLQPGDRIPKEVELAAAMGVSRTAIREALSRFKTLGIIESKKNRGMVITRPDILSNLHRVLDPQLLDGETMKEIFEMRLVLEIGIADILFLRKNASNLIKLEAIVEKEEKTADKIERIKQDIEFHSMLYEISGNDTILRFQKILLPVFDYVDKGSHFNRQTSTYNAVSHRDLLDVLRMGTAEEFRDKMRIHLRPYFDQIE